MKLEKQILFEPGYDKRHSDPSLNYGIHGMNVRFLLKGEKGVIQFLLYTDWLPLKTQKEFINEHDGIRQEVIGVQPMAADIGYHSPVPMYEGQNPIQSSCEYLDGNPCYYDGSSLQAGEIRNRFLEEGADAVWSAMVEHYERRFGDRDL